MKNSSPTIISGIQTEGTHQYHYTGLQLGKLQYRIYEDREGWFEKGEYTALPPKGASATRIKRALEQAGKQAFLTYMSGDLQKWELKEKAGI